MAGYSFQFTTGEISLVAATAKTVWIMSAPANQRVLVTNLTCAGKGTVATDAPIYCRVYRATSAGTTTAVTPTEYDPGDDESVQTTVGKNASAEPSVGDVIDEFYFHPTGGIVRNHLQARPYLIKAGTRLALEMTATQAQTVVCTVEADE